MITGVILFVAACLVVWSALASLRSQVATAKENREWRAEADRKLRKANDKWLDEYRAMLRQDLGVDQQQLLVLLSRLARITVTPPGFDRTYRVFMDFDERVLYTAGSDERAKQLLARHAAMAVEKAFLEAAP